MEPTDPTKNEDGTAKPLVLTHTRKALALYELIESRLDAAVDEADDDASMRIARDRQASEQRKVNLAFFEDTKDRNSQADAMAASISFLRQLCIKYPE